MTDTVTEQLVIKRVPIDKLSVNETNPRRISKARFEDLKKALAADPQMLEVRPLIADLNGVVFAGNMRLRAAQDLGWTDIPAALVDLDDERKAYWTFRDNAGYGEWDEEMLAEQMFQLNELNYDLQLTGFSKEEVDAILASTGVGGDAPEEKGSSLDVAAVTLADPILKVTPGDVWSVGKHVLICANVFTGHKHWLEYLAETGTLFLPFAGPGVTLARSSDRHKLVMVQPDTWIAGHLLDAHERIHPGTVTKR